jgi:hypothetical protein
LPALIADVPEEPEPIPAELDALAEVGKGELFCMVGLSLKDQTIKPKADSSAFTRTLGRCGARHVRAKVRTM